MKEKKYISADCLIKISLLGLLAMILGTVVIGGLTRLSGAGLSIVEWKPITGIFPPLTTEGWLYEFSKYQASPEFIKINLGMTLEEFRSIFWLEYIHRIWGRLLGVVMLVPTYLIVFKKQHRELLPYLVLLWICGSAQGLMGWWMVKSGLINDPHVSPYRLAAHLLLGFAIFGMTLWMILILFKDKLSLNRLGSSLKALTHIQMALVSIGTIVLIAAALGALVAGFKAGLIYNTFPLMGEYIIPPEVYNDTVWWESPVTLQFFHRVFAIIAGLSCLGLWIYQRSKEIPPRLSFLLSCVALAAFAQISLGILTLLWVVPLSLALVHQTFAFVLFGLILSVIYSIRQSNSLTSIAS